MPSIETPMPGLAPRRMRMVPGLAELGFAWCSKPDIETDAWGLPGTANCCCEQCDVRSHAVSGCVGGGSLRSMA
jgi:hypothetical protein